MNFLQRAVLCGGMAFGAAAAEAALSPEQLARLPAPTTAPVDFARDVKPIFDSACVKCHGKGKDKGGFSLETRELFFKGGDSGAPVVSGKSAQSLLIELVSGLDPEKVMPAKGSKLKPEQVSLLRAWIDQGAVWPAEVTFAKTPVHNLHPRKPEVPPATDGASNPIDRLLTPYFAAHRVSSGKSVEDRIFARRVYLDVVGLLPSPKELEEFVSDIAPDKRSRLVTKLLSDNRRYAEHWLTFWNDLLRNDYRGTGYIDGGRKQISSWLFSALLTNMPYDRFVAQLVNPTPESEGFINGISWRGAVNASQIPPMQAAQSIGQVFMGVNLKCASCHDSFINDYTLADSYGIAAIYATNDLSIAECDKPTGRKAKVKFLYSELGEIDGSLPKPERARQLAELLTSKKDGRLTRTVVNRLWAELMGRGLVEPVDEMDTPAWNRDLLDWLAEDFAENGYDLKRTMRWILTSRAYQMPSVNLGERVGKDFVFSGPAIRRMDAEQFRDALGELTGVWYEKPGSTFDFTGTGTPRVPRAAKWIWSEPGAEKKALAETIYLRKEFTLAAVPEEAIAAIACDNGFTLYVNGKQVVSGKEYQQPSFADLRPHLKAGENVIAVAAVNNTPDNKPPRPEDTPKESDANSAGFIFAARLRGGTLNEINSDASWVWSKSKTNGWEKIGFESAGWERVAELGPVNMKPWTLAGKLNQAMSMASVHGTVRASLVAADPLMLALGRPNREQVTTARQSVATTLQGLELTNGETLNKVLKRGAQKLLAGNKLSADELVSKIFVKSLSRKPTESELTLAKELLGAPVKEEGVEDLLWSVAMLPEFQLIY
jgi:mono/diheme cytochrome c family protein